jgi:hypothetical protein
MTQSRGRLWGEFVDVVTADQRYSDPGSPPASSSPPAAASVDADLDAAISNLQAADAALDSRDAIITPETPGWPEPAAPDPDMGIDWPSKVESQRTSAPGTSV